MEVTEFGDGQIHEIYRISYMWGSRGSSEKKGAGDTKKTKEMAGRS